MAEKSIHLGTLEKLQFALRDFDMSFSTSNKLFRLAIVSEIIDTIGLFEQLAEDWKTNLPFGEGPDADIDFDYWTDLGTWENLHCRAMQNECVDSLPISFGNGRTSDDVRRIKKSSYTKYFNSVLKTARYEGRCNTVDFLKFLLDDKTGTTSFGTIVFHGVCQLVSAMRKANEVLKSPSEAALLKYYEAQLYRSRAFIELGIRRIRDISRDTTIPDKRKENNLRAMKDDLGETLRMSHFLEDIKGTYNQYDIADYRKENKQHSNLPDERVLDILAISDLFDKEGNPRKTKIARHIFNNRKILRDVDIAAFYAYTIVIPLIDEALAKYNAHSKSNETNSVTLQSFLNDVLPNTDLRHLEVHLHFENIEQFAMGDNVQNKL